MDMDLFSNLLLLLLVSCFVSVFVFVFKSGSKANTSLPPGPWKLPLIGNLHLLAASAPIPRILRNLATKYGGLMHLQLGQIGAVVVSSPETAKQFLKTHDAVFASRPSLLATEINCFGNTDIAFAPYGDYWRQLRKICTLQLLTAKRVQSFRPIREEEVSELCRRVAEKEGSTINLTEEVSTVNLNIMVRAAFGTKSGGEVGLLKDIIKEAHQFFTFFNIVDVYPSFRFLRVLSRMKRKIEAQHLHLDRITGNIIEERRQQRQQRQRSESRDERDLLDVLLTLQEDGSLQIPLTTDNIKAVLLDGAGIDSSTATVNWAMAEMVNNPGVLTRAQDEVRGVFEGKEYVGECLFHELKYLKLVIKETLRLHPPGPLLLPRESRERCEINGYEIPAKTWVLVNAWAMGRDPMYWEEAESFNPERFIEKPLDFNAAELEYIPFGAGRRICPGMGFGIANIESQLAMLLYHFDWIRPHGIKVDMEEISGVSGRKKLDLTLIPIVRRPLL